MTPTPAERFPIFPELAGTRRFTVAEYDRLGDAGILGPEDKVELLDGYRNCNRRTGRSPAWRALRRWTSAEFQRMLELGIIGREEKVEFLDGYVVQKA